MIGVSSSSRRFEALGTYLVAGRSGSERDRVAWSASRNLPTADPELGAKIMRATAAQNVRVDKPVYHLALSFDPGDAVDRATMERVADRAIGALGLEGHQVIIVAHKDREHPHVHLLVNRVHPETGRVWSRWQDQRVVQEVLRDEERALGLRQVPGSLTRSVDQFDGRAGPAAGADRDTGAAVRASEAPPGSRQPLVAELASNLRLYEQVADLTQLQYAAKLDAEAARARSEQLTSAFDRSRRADDEFLRALAGVFRSPAAAREAFASIATNQSVEEAVRILREAPERLGPLMTVEERGPLGIGRKVDDRAARALASRAAYLGEGATAAERSLWATTAQMCERTQEDGFRRELRTLYADPDKATVAFRSLASEQGLDGAVTVLGNRPADLGELRPAVQGDDVRASTLAAAAARTAIEARRAVAIPAAVIGTLDPDIARKELTAERGASEAHAADATVRERELRRELDGVPALPELRAQIVDAADRLLPRDLRRLRTMISAPQMALMATLRATVRDALLARESERSV